MRGTSPERTAAAPRRRASTAAVAGLLLRLLEEPLALPRDLDAPISSQFAANCAFCVLSSDASSRCAAASSARSNAANAAASSGCIGLGSAVGGSCDDTDFDFLPAGGLLRTGAFRAAAPLGALRSAAASASARAGAFPAVLRRARPPWELSMLGNGDNAPTVQQCTVHSARWPPRSACTPRQPPSPVRQLLRWRRLGPGE
jgi:hypothetical protein